MRQKLFDNFNPLTDKLEGHLPYMYLDTEGLVTIGRGNLIDPVASAVCLGFVNNADGTAATVKTIKAQWALVKSRKDLCARGGQAFRLITTITLPEKAIDELCTVRLAANESLVKAQFPDWPSYPADAQWGLMSMAWARGPNNFHGGYPHFSAAVEAKDWLEAGKQCRMNGCSNERNVTTAKAFFLAARLVECGGDPETFLSLLM